jgi:hypothetical protein
MLDKALSGYIRQYRCADCDFSFAKGSCHG